METQTREYVLANFQALTDALLPSLNPYGNGPSYSPADLGIHEYVIYGLNHYISIKQQLHYRIVPLAYPTAMMLDAAAAQLVNIQQIQVLSQNQFQGGGVFSRLSLMDRVRTLSALENLTIDLYLLPSPYKNNGGMVKHVIDALNRFSMFGYYSEWPAYGSTRLSPPDERRLVFFPPAWQQVGYPGVALGYRDFRGFLMTMEEVKA